MNVSAKRTDLNYFSQKNTLIFNFQFSILNYERSSTNRNLAIRKGISPKNEKSFLCKMEKVKLGTVIHSGFVL